VEVRELRVDHRSGNPAFLEDLEALETHGALTGAARAVDYQYLGHGWTLAGGCPVAVEERKDSARERRQPLALQAVRT
jgi:hypothetical protein